MPMPDEYDTWHCDNCPDGALCKAEWQECDCCDNHQTHAGTDCDDCSGAGGGHVCIHEFGTPKERTLFMTNCQSCDKKAKQIVKYKDLSLGKDELRLYEAHLCSECCESFKDQANTQKLPIIMSQQTISL